MLTLLNTVSRRLSTRVPLQQFGSPCCAARFLTSALVSPPRTINQHSGGLRGFSFVPGSTCQVDVIRDGNYCAAEVVTVLPNGCSCSPPTRTSLVSLFHTDHWPEQVLEA